MQEVLASLASGPPSALFILAVCSAWTVVAIVGLWAIGLAQGNHSLADAYYGFGFAIQASIAYGLGAAASPTAAVLLVLTALHGCRLGAYLTRRWLAYRATSGGDQRYLNFRRQYSPGYWWKSLVIVMAPQAVVIALVGLPATWGILANRGPGAPLGLWSLAGVAVFGIGWYFETVADGQLQAFKADPANQGRYLRTGVWTHSRHPNYFGNATVWWGIWLVAVAGNPDAWWTVVAPLLNTIMLTSVFGRAFQDRYLGARPDYRKLMAETRGFLPLPPRRS